MTLQTPSKTAAHLCVCLYIYQILNQCVTKELHNFTLWHIFYELVFTLSQPLVKSLNISLKVGCNVLYRTRRSMVSLWKTVVPFCFSILYFISEINICSMSFNIFLSPHQGLKSVISNTKKDFRARRDQEGSVRTINIIQTI